MELFQLRRLNLSSCTMKCLLAFVLVIVGVWQEAPFQHKYAQPKSFNLSLKRTVISHLVLLALEPAWAKGFMSVLKLKQIMTVMELCQGVPWAMLWEHQQPILVGFLYYGQESVDTQERVTLSAQALEEAVLWISTFHQRILALEETVIFSPVISSSLPRLNPSLLHQRQETLLWRTRLTNSSLFFPTRISPLPMLSMKLFLVIMNMVSLCKEGSGHVLRNSVYFPLIIPIHVFVQVMGRLSPIAKFLGG